VCASWRAGCLENPWAKKLTCTAHILGLVHWICILKHPQGSKPRCAALIQFQIYFKFINQQTSPISNFHNCTLPLTFSDPAMSTACTHREVTQAPGIDCQCACKFPPFPLIQLPASGQVFCLSPKTKPPLSVGTLEVGVFSPKT
jgi:hypothetical protein